MGSLTQRMRKDAAARAYVAREVVVYLCPTCNKRTITVKLDEGTVPPTLGCRATGGCDGMADQEPNPPHGADRRPPRWEWYRPSVGAFKRLRREGGAMWEHVQYGGLLIRRRP